MNSLTQLFKTCSSQLFSILGSKTIVRTKVAVSEQFLEGEYCCIFPLNPDEK
ncbi:hypothetical protein FDUTEX481_09151 [Tolypothrix sp. PCC 7601]|nr:hypothetical protein FDUTEX481_09151 [Tolypothrix sp. PCC 7601]